MKQESVIEQLQIAVEGVVQGVGFRPAVYRIAKSMGLSGTVQNQGRCVLIIIEGRRETLSGFVQALRANLPTQARIDVVNEHWCAPAYFTDFLIIDSALSGEVDLAIPADLATCHDCWHEFKEPGNRRYMYPFTTCVACGPRYTVIEAMPYDRCRTTLHQFPLCEACLAEYEDPMNRRFHAESTACPVCGPSVALYDSRFSPIEATPREIPGRVRKALARGEIIALRGLGGYLLCCDALCADAVSLMRKRKAREHQPFAVMARSSELVRRHFKLSPQDEQLLLSPEGPIVILSVKDDSPLDLSVIAPDTRDVGIMVPTTPLHWLLFHNESDQKPMFDFLIMTSGNAHGEPICRDDEEARERLTGLFDLALTHDRGIARVCDDSLFHSSAGSQRVLRRARGLAPDKVDLPFALKTPVLAMGADLKNALALGYGRKAILSPHIGDLNYLATNKAYRRLTQELVRFFDRTPGRVAVDMHPDYMSTTWGRQYAADHGIEVVAVQHHHAHAAGCLAEHGRTEGLALVFDGSGYGPDETIWGGEFFHVRADGTYHRLGALKPTPLVGGEAAIIRPLRLAVTRLSAMGVAADDALYTKLGFDPGEVKLCYSAVAMDSGRVMTSSAGRLFDVVAALLGLSPGKITYEGQAAIRLEALARQAIGAGDFKDLVHAVGDGCFYPFGFAGQGGTLFADSDLVLRGVLQDILAGLPPARIALKFHLSLAQLANHFAADGCGRTASRTVVLSGGVMQNRLLVDMVFVLLAEAGFEVLAHRKVPANDGGIALGQVVIAGQL